MHRGSRTHRWMIRRASARYRRIRKPLWVAAFRGSSSTCGCSGRTLDPVVRDPYVKEDVMAVAALGAVVLDCPDPRALAAFYAAVLGGTVEDEEDWVDLKLPGGGTLAFQAAP